jgi:hypothetical protein
MDNEQVLYASTFNVLLMCVVTEEIETFATFISRQFK